MDTGHETALRRLLRGDDRLRTLRSFDPGADDVDVPDPYYGDFAGFTEVLEIVEAAMPGLIAWVRAQAG
jgi:protein-tyrosine phosphatase